MAQIINTNISSLTAQRNLNTSQSSLATSFQRLSSGLRINSAKDDAAGLAISERFSTQIRGLNQAIRNASDGISLAQTGEGALNEVVNNLQRIRELAVQSANATNSASDRAALDQEVQQRLAEIERVAVQTSFNGQKILDGTFGSAQFQVGANVGDTISVNLNTSTRLTSIGKTADYVGGVAYNSALAVGQQGAGVDTSAISSGDVTIALGSGAAVTVVASTDASAKSKVEAVNASGIAGLTATADTTVQFDTATTAIAATEDDYNLTINGVAIYTNYDGTADGAISADAFVAAINANTSATGVTASYDSANTRLTLTAGDGRDITVIQDRGQATVDGLGVLEGTNNSTNTTVAGFASGAASETNIYGGSIRLVAAEQITIGGTAARIGFAATSLALGNSALDTASVTTVANSETTITRVDAALTAISSLRSEFGAIQNRFESVIANLEATTENLTASRSRIQDADFAAETANLTRAQILQQAGITILAQANAQPQNVLALLQ